MRAIAGRTAPCATFPSLGSRRIIEVHVALRGFHEYKTVFELK